MEVNRKVVHHSNTSTPVVTPLATTPAATPDLDQVLLLAGFLSVPFAVLFECLSNTLFLTRPLNTYKNIYQNYRNYIEN